MLDFALARRMMVDSQIRPSDVTDLSIIAAMLDVERERFVAPSRTGLAYLDIDVPVNEPTDGRSARCLLKPMVLAKLIQAAEITATDTVLDVGCASGYSTVVLARLAASVVALEEDAALAAWAKAKLAEAGAAHIAVVVGPLASGWSTGGAYDVIILEGATEISPRALFGQLNDGGRLVCVQGRDAAKAMLYRSSAGEVSGRVLFDAAAPPLPGFAERPAFVF